MNLATGPVIQICWVVEDIEKAERFHSEHLGAGAWTRILNVHFGPDDCVLWGQPADFVIHVSLAYIGDMQIELIQPVSGASIYAQFFDAFGPGLHHVCFESDDIAATMRAARASGLAVVQHGRMAGGLMAFAYVDGSQAGAPYIEFAQFSPDMVAFNAAVKANGAIA